MTVRQTLLVASALAMFLLHGCSGSTLDSDTDTPDPDVLVDAGGDQTVSEQTDVTLSAVATGQTDTLTYTWSVSPDITITQEDTNAAEASFTAPETTETLVYTFTLTVTDEDGNSGSDTVEYQVDPVNISPIAEIEVPEVEGLQSNVFPAGYSITLDGTASDDADSADESNPIAAYLWQQTAGESVLDDTSTQGDTLTFDSPLLEDENSITLTLTVTDEEGAEDTETVTLTIQSTSQTLPVINAGLDHEVFSGETILLNGEAETTVDSSNPLVISWLSESDETVSIDDDSVVQTFAVAPLVTETLTLTFTMQVEDAIGNEVEDNVTVNVLPLPIQPLNDTGVSQQATSSAITSEHQADYPGQDGQRGQDIIYINGSSTKAGRGQQGFDFTALDSIGDEVDDTSLDWSCVRDNITGLIWEVKDESGTTGLHSSDHNYSWYQDDDNGGDEGDETGSAAICSITECNTTAYVEEVNTQGLCNFKDWRLPTHDELLSILHLGMESAPMIDDEYFPNTTESLGDVVWYWTSGSSADGMSDDLAHNAWAIDFASGNDNFLDKSTAARVRLVRAGR